MPDELMIMKKGLSVTLLAVGNAFRNVFEMGVCYTFLIKNS